MAIFYRIRLAAAISAASLMCIEPTAMAVSTADQKVILQGLERTGMLTRELTLAEFYKSLKPNLSPNDQYNFEQVLKMYPSFMMPKMVVSRIPAGKGEQDLQIQFSRAHESGSMIIYARGGIFARMAGVNFTYEDMQNPVKFAQKFEEVAKNIDGRQPASEEREPAGIVYRPKATSQVASPKKKSTRSRLLSYREFKSMTPKEQAQYINLLRGLAGQMEKVQNIRIAHSSKGQFPSHKRKPASANPSEDKSEQKPSSQLENSTLNKWSALFSDWENEAWADGTCNKTIDPNETDPAKVADMYCLGPVPQGETIPATTFASPLAPIVTSDAVLPYVDPNQQAFQTCMQKKSTWGSEIGMTSGMAAVREGCKASNPPPDQKTVLRNLIIAQNKQSADNSTTNSKAHADRQTEFKDDFSNKTATSGKVWMKVHADECDGYRSLSASDQSALTNNSQWSTICAHFAPQDQANAASDTAAKVKAREAQMAAVQLYNSKNPANKFTSADHTVLFPDQAINNAAVPKLAADTGAPAPTAPSVPAKTAATAGPAVSGVNTGTGAGTGGGGTRQTRAVSRDVTLSADGPGGGDNQGSQNLDDERNNQNFRADAPLPQAEAQRIDSGAKKDDRTNDGKAVSPGMDCLLAGNMTKYGCTDSTCTTLVCGAGEAADATHPPGWKCTISASNSVGVRCNTDLYGDNSPCVAMTPHSTQDCNSKVSPADLYKSKNPKGVSGQAAWDKTRTDMEKPSIDKSYFAPAVSSGGVNDAYADQVEACGALNDRYKKLMN